MKLEIDLSITNANCEEKPRNECVERRCKINVFNETRNIFTGSQWRHSEIKLISFHFTFMFIYLSFCVPFNNMLTRDKCNNVDMWRSIIFIFLIISILIGLTWEIEPHETKPIKHSV